MPRRLRDCHARNANDASAATVPALSSPAESVPPIHHAQPNDSPGALARTAALWVALGALAGAVAGCGHASAPSPFVADSGTDAAVEAGGAGGAGGADSGVAPDAGANVGGPCVDDAQCDDAIDCTFDHCDTSIGRCRFDPDDTRCADGVYCNGTEICDPATGCKPGDPVTCSDSNVCTIDACVEATHACTHTPRDADGDGDPVWNCGGGDCNDSDPRVSSLALEICGNGVDDDCDGVIDEPDCTSPQHDTCADPLEIQASGSYELSTVAAKGDYALSCASGGGAWRDVVAAIVVPQGPSIDVDVIARAPSGQIALGSAAQCGDASTELGCEQSSALPDGSVGARLVLHGLAPGAYPLFLFSNSDVVASLHVEFRAASTAPANETCATAAPITPGTDVQLSLADAKRDLVTACPAGSGDLVYRLQLTESQDVHVYATSLLGLGTPAVSLRSAACAGAGAGPSDEITCRAGDNPDLFVRALAPGDYYVSVASTGPDDLDLRVQTSPPTTAPADETCATAPDLALDKTIDVSMADHTDDYQVGCSVGTPDAAYRLALSQSTDLLLVARIASTDTGAVLLARPACSAAADTLTCARSTLSPIRVSRRGVPPGDYRAVVESANGTAMQLTAFTRPATLPTLVAFADDCAHAVEITAPGGFFQGSTANAKADYSAGCDLGGQPPGGGRDQMLTFTLDRTQRVVLDMRGSSYATLLDVRRGPSCPGDEVLSGCAAGYYPTRSYLDLTLDPGQYFVQIDGFAGDSGSWVLDAYIVDP